MRDIRIFRSSYYFSKDFMLKRLSQLVDNVCFPSFSLFINSFWQAEIFVIGNNHINL